MNLELLSFSHKFNEDVNEEIRRIGFGDENENKIK